jgi:hypothetical protein
MDSFWNHHGLWFIFFMAFFPRLTLLLSSVPFGGILWWLGWLITPRLLVAVLATTNYWTTDPIRCVLAWIWAFGGEGAEKTAMVYKRPRRIRYE